MRGVAALFATAVASLSGNLPTPPTNSGSALSPPLQFQFTLLDTYPHDPSAFTQGLHYEPSSKTLLESTGLYGESSVRRVDIETGRALLMESLERRWFGEGLSVHADTCVQLLWREGLCLVRDAQTFALRRTAPLPRGMLEGWGLTTDGAGAFYASDGTDKLHVLDAETLQVTRTVKVRYGGDRFSGARPLHRINDLQWVRGEVWANVWGEDSVVVIDPHTGGVRAFVDLSSLLDAAERRQLNSEQCLNGIAYDAGADELYVTGKCWPKLFKIKVHAAGDGERSSASGGA